MGEKESNVKGMLTLEQLEAAIRGGSIDTLILAICDMQGRLMGKRLTGDYVLRQGIVKGTHFCVYLLGTDMAMNTPTGYQLMSWESGYGDWLAAPDWTTLRMIPWLDKTAMVLCDVLDEKTGLLVPIAPRTILKAQLEKAAEKGVRFKAASELEFYLFKEPYDAIYRKNYSGMQAAGHYNEDYHLLQGTRNEPIYRTIRNQMIEAGIPIESSKGEAYTGQHEMNLLYGDALVSADRHLLFKHGVKEIAIQHDCAVTFMAKPHHQWTGSSGHLHISMWDAEEERNLFYDPQAEPHHMSESIRHFLGGVLAFTRDFSLCFASNINSYKRYASESWAPVSLVWSVDNRTSGFRIVGERQSLRIENRIPGADMNPYLAYAAMIGAGMYGVESKLEPPPEFKGNAYARCDLPRIPSTLGEAKELWRESPVVQRVFGEQVAQHYYNMARVEQQAFDAVVTDWERSRYFEQG
ncbi:glutamine synthetase [Paenibacillus cremeus]|uniref:Glutamine synthetase n=2 Tax=Paenibacillus cremeus TaxID=2163881 RepID=A0A559JZW6_9BACL|nr:glutamine synthetase [Paenibacillus cremeus]